MTFSNLGISDELIKILLDQGITEPTDIQEKACPCLLAGADAWLSSATGSGKTLAYVLPPLSKIDANGLHMQLAILAPTHELVAQIANVIRGLGEGLTKKIRVQTLVGNSPIERQKDKLKLKPHIVVGTLGRMLELVSAKKLKMDQCKTIVIDEADRLLIEKSALDVEAFIHSAPANCQIIFASASEQHDALITAKTMRPHLQYLMAALKPLDESIDHYYIRSEHRHKGDTVRQLLHALQAERAMVFMHRNEDVDRLFTILESKDLNVVSIHGQCDKLDRQKALNAFRKGQARVLISSDVAARGLDIKGVDCIVNLDLPSHAQDYLHRVGRTGRAGARGISISLVAPNEMSIIKSYQQEFNIKLLAASLTRGKFFVD